MKLFIIATLVAAAAAARLDHLERGYLPPESQTSNSVSSQSNGSSQTSFGSSGQAFSSSGSGEFGAAQGSFGATSNQYLPPDHGPSSGSNFGNLAAQTPRPSSGNGQGSQSAQYQPQPSAPNRQYLGPQTANIQSSTLQPFDEETGYHYK